MSLLHKLARHRTAALPGAAEGSPKAAQKTAVDPEVFSGAQVSEKLISKFGAQLKPAAAEMATIGRMAATLKPHKVTQFSNALDRYYGALGKFLEEVPAKDHKQVVTVATQALQKVVERIGPGDRLVGGIEVLSSLLFHGRTDRTFAARTEAAEKVSAQLLDMLEGRLGAGGSCFVFRNLIEAGANRQVDQSLASKEANWSGALSLIARGTPTRGASQAQLGALFGHFQAACGEGGTLDQIYDRAIQRAVSPHQAGVMALAEQLRQPVDLEEGSPGQRVDRIMVETLSKLTEGTAAGYPILGQQIEALAGRISGHAKRIKEDSVPVYQNLARLLEGLAERASLSVTLDYLSRALPELAERPGMATKLAKLKSPEDLPRALLESEAERIGKDVTGLEAALKNLDRLPSGLGTAAAVALLPHVAPAVVPTELLIKAGATLARGAETIDELNGRIQSYTAAFPAIDQALGAQHAQVLALALALELNNGPPKADAVPRLIQHATQLLAILPELPLNKVVLPDRGNELSLLSIDGPTHQGRDPGDYLGRLFETLTADRTMSAEVQASLARLTFRLANQVARLDRDPETILPRILEDWRQAIEQPATLHFALRPGKSTAVQAKGELSALGFLSAHSELPIELALTAGTHLSSEQLTWLSETIKSERSHGKIRQLRDLIFAAIELGRLDFLDALRSSKSPPKTKEAAITHVIENHRAGPMPEGRLDLLMQGLAAGTDPLAPLKEELPVVPAAAAPGRPHAGRDDVGALQRNHANIQGMLTHPPVAAYRDKLEAVLTAYGNGTLRKVKYEGPLADRLLAGLTPHQRAVWIQCDATSKGGGIEEGPELAAHLPMLKGLESLFERINLATAEWPDLKFDQASLDVLRALQNQQLEQLRAHAKGSDEHRTAGRALGPINHRIALIDLKLQLSHQLAMNTPAGAMLYALRQPLGEAARGLQAFGARAGAEAARELAEVGKKLKLEPRQGLHVTDDDSLDGYMNSFAGGCINPAGGFNRHYLVEKMTSPLYKMGRGMNGTVPQTRGFFRLVNVEIGNYKGFAIWSDTPQNMPTGRVTAELQQLLAEHALAKAMAMGIPLLTAGDGQSVQAAQKRGMALQATAVKVKIDHGVTGHHHTEYLTGAGYSHDMVPGQVDTFNYNYHVAFPPGFAR
jgi:hypothetical protein